MKKIVLMLATVATIAASVSAPAMAQPLRGYYRGGVHAGIGRGYVPAGAIAAAAIAATAAAAASPYGYGYGYGPGYYYGPAPVYYGNPVGYGW